MTIIFEFKIYVVIEKSKKVLFSAWTAPNPQTLRRESRERARRERERAGGERRAIKTEKMGVLIPV
jgi:hypothetical protein